VIINYININPADNYRLEKFYIIDILAQKYFSVDKNISFVLFTRNSNEYENVEPFSGKDLQIPLKYNDIRIVEASKRVDKNILKYLGAIREQVVVINLEKLPISVIQLSAKNDYIIIKDSLPFTKQEFDFIIEQNLKCYLNVYNNKGVDFTDKDFLIKAAQTFESMPDNTLIYMYAQFISNYLFDKENGKNNTQFLNRTIIEMPEFKIQYHSPENISIKDFVDETAELFIKSANFEIETSMQNFKQILTGFFKI
jgi:hypothetical protein